MLGPGEKNTFTIKVENGPLYMLCFSRPPDLPIGGLGPFDVDSGLPSATAAADVPTVTFTGSTCTYSGPEKVAAGNLSLNLINSDKKMSGYTVAVLSLQEGKTVEDLRSWKSDDLPPWASLLSLLSIFPGENSLKKLEVKPGPIFLACAVGPEGSEKVVWSLGPVDVQ